jgi:ATP-dependent DNA ligase
MALGRSPTSLPSRCRFVSRRGNQMRNLSDLIARGLKVKQAVLDGEIFALDEAGRPAFYDLMKRQCQAVCYGFDILCLNGRLRELSLVERKKILRTAIPRKLLDREAVKLFDLVKTRTLRAWW